MSSSPGPRIAVVGGGRFGLRRFGQDERRLLLGHGLAGVLVQVGQVDLLDASQQVLLAELEPGRAPVDDAAQGVPVALAERGHDEILAEAE